MDGTGRARRGRRCGRSQDVGDRGTGVLRGEPKGRRGGEYGSPVGILTSGGRKDARVRPKSHEPEGRDRD